MSSLFPVGRRGLREARREGAERAHTWVPIPLRWLVSVRGRRLGKRENVCVCARARDSLASRGGEAPGEAAATPNRGGCGGV